MIPKTSAVVTCRNYGRFLPDCLESLLNQTLPFFEIVLVDDSSEDETPDLWRKLYRGRVLYKRGKFGRQMAARQAGVEITSGDFLVCIDADDWVRPDYHEKMAGLFDGDDALGVVYCGLSYIFQESGENWFPEKTAPDTDFSAFRLCRYSYFPNAAIVRREAWPSTFGRDYGAPLQNGLTFAEDWDFFLQILMQGWRFAGVPEKLFYYRIHENNTSRSVLEDRGHTQEVLWKVRARYFPYDLTLIVLFGRLSVNLSRYLLNTLQPIEKTARIQILFVIPDTVENDDRLAEIRAYCTHLLKVAIPENLSGIARITAMLMQAEEQVVGREVLILSGGQSPESDFPDKGSGFRIPRAVRMPARSFYETFNRGVRKSGQDEVFKEMMTQVVMDCPLSQEKATVQEAEAAKEEGPRRKDKNKSSGLHKRPLLLDACFQLLVPSPEPGKIKGVLLFFWFCAQFLLNRQRFILIHDKTGGDRENPIIRLQTSGKQVSLFDSRDRFFLPSRIVFPIAACVLDSIDGSLDLEAYKKAAKHSKWPVWIIGNPKPHFYEKILSETKGALNLHWMFVFNWRRHWDALKKVLGLGLYMFKDDPPQKTEILPPEVLALARSGFPLITASVPPLPENAVPGHSAVQDHVEMMRKINFEQEFPAWNLSHAFLQDRPHA